MILTSAVAAGIRCPVCGDPHRACGGPTPETIPLDLPRFTERAVMAETDEGELGVYDAVVNGNPTQLQLTRKQAAELGLKPSKPEPENKQGTAENK